ncbi:MAG: hypothetical protein AB1585_03090, partial [Thermodesulfobacteriota bacterium]
TPAALTVAEQRLVGRITGGSIDDLTGAQVRTLLGTNPFVVGSDADGDIWYRAGGALTRLAKGTANHKMFMNAAATAPEWAKGLYEGTFEHDLSAASGTQEITGVGFKPSMIIILSARSNSPGFCLGFDDGSNHYHILNYDISNIVGSGYSLGWADSTVTNYATGAITTLGSDGFTVTWTKTGSPTGTLIASYLALR